MSTLGLFKGPNSGSSLPNLFFLLNSFGFVQSLVSFDVPLFGNFVSVTTFPVRSNSWGENYLTHIRNSLPLSGRLDFRTLNCM